MNDKSDIKDTLPSIPGIPMYNHLFILISEYPNSKLKCDSIQLNEHYGLMFRSSISYK